MAQIEMNRVMYCYRRGISLNWYTETKAVNINESIKFTSGQASISTCSMPVSITTIKACTSSRCMYIQTCSCSAIWCMYVRMYVVCLCMGHMGLLQIQCHLLVVDLNSSQCRQAFMLLYLCRSVV